jgi:multiple sugar transport system substrate-binding protein
LTDTVGACLALLCVFAIGLAVLKGASDMSEAMALVDYLTQQETQIVTAREVGFFPVVQAKFSSTSDPGLKMAAVAIQRMQSARDAMPALPPVGLGEHDADFDKVFMNAFQLIVLRGQKPRAVLDREAETLQQLMTETGAPCWQPDPPSTGPCQVQ